MFINCYNTCDVEQKIEIHNIYSRENNCDNEIFYNDEDFFGMFFEGKPMEAVRSICFGKYNYNDNYVWFNGYGNLVSSDYEDEMPLADEEEMAEWFIENYDEIEHIEEMQDFYNACANR